MNCTSFVRKRNIWMNFMYLSILPHLHTVCNLQLDLIKTGFHHTASFAFPWFNMKVIRRSWISTFLEILATKFRENSHGQHNSVTFLNRCSRIYGFSWLTWPYVKVYAINICATNELWQIMENMRIIVQIYKRFNGIDN